MSATLDNLLNAVRSLPLAERRQLAARLNKELEATEQQVQENRAIVRETRGTIKGLDRETIIALAEDEEYCGY